MKNNVFPLKEINAIAFDFDGVIADSEPLHLEAWNRAMSACGIERTITMEEMVGKPVETFARSFGDAQRAQEVAEAKRAAAYALAQEKSIPLYPAALSVIKNMATRYKLAVVSSGEARLVRMTLAHYELDQYFCCTVLEDDYQFGKPDPEPYQICARNLGVQPSALVAIEDSVAGVASAKDAGLQVVGVTTTTQRARLSRADRIIDTLAQFPTLLDC